MARQLELESLCAESKDIPGLRLLHLEVCHSPASPTPTSQLQRLHWAPQTQLGAKLRIVGNPGVYILYA